MITSLRLRAAGAVVASGLLAAGLFSSPAAAAPEQSLRRAGGVAVALGALIVWLVRG